jgi:hypothetical protein
MQRRLLAELVAAREVIDVHVAALKSQGRGGTHGE